MGFCFPAFDRFVAIETPDESQPTATLALYRASDGRPVWSLGTAGVMASSPMVEGADASAVYFSWMESGKVMLRALRGRTGKRVDGRSRRDRPAAFQFDAEGALFGPTFRRRAVGAAHRPRARERCLDVPAGRGRRARHRRLGGVRRRQGRPEPLGPRQGHRHPAVDLPRAERPIVAVVGRALHALRRPAHQPAQRERDPEQRHGRAHHAAHGGQRNGRRRCSVGPHTAVLPVTSGPRTFVWETPAGELYETTYGVLARLDPTTGSRLWTSPT